jgi:hypothetical protein
VETEVMGNDEPIRDLEARWGISRNALKSRAAALGVDLIRVSSTDTRWPAAYVDLGDQLHHHLQAGGTLKDFPGSKPVTASTAATTASSSKAITKAGDVEALAAVVAAALTQASFLPAADPLQRAKALAEAADNGLVLTTDELQALGVKGVDGFADGDLAYGYVFCKHNQRNRTLWTVERAIAARPVTDGSVPALTPSKAEKRVGFDVAAAITLEPVDHRGSRLFAINTLS